MPFEVKSVLIADPLDESAVRILQDAGAQVHQKPGLERSVLVQTIKDYDALIVRSGCKVDAEIIANGTNLKAICRAGVGVDNIDVDAATKHQVPVINSPGGNTIAATEMTCGLILSLARHVAPACNQLKSGVWNRKIWTGSEVYGKTLGVIGLGRIGREVAFRMKSFGMQLIGYDPILTADQAAQFGVEFVDLDQLYQRSDYITIHVPLVEQTRNMINKHTLAQCRPGVHIVNCSRGGIVNEQDALDALDSGHVAGLALDVFEQEPPTGPVTRKLIEHIKVVATPHLGASTVEAQQKVAVDVAQQLLSLSRDQPVHGCVNPTVIKRVA